MSDERKPLELTDDQKDALTEALRVAMGIEWEDQVTAMDGVVTLWPLIRDYVLEEAAKACEAATAKAAPPMISGFLCHEDQLYCLGLKRAADLIRAMKGKP